MLKGKNENKLHRCEMQSKLLEANMALKDVVISEDFSEKS